MEAGPKLDALIAENVMGWKRQENIAWRTPHVYLYVDHNGHIRLPEEVPHYSTDISAAWQVVEAIERRGWFVEVGLCNAEYGPKKRAWCQVGVYGDNGAYVGEAYEDTAPLATCLAALRAIGVEV
jgi:hypothetical protein